MLEPRCWRKIATISRAASKNTWRNNGTRDAMEPRSLYVSQFFFVCEYVVLRAHSLTSRARID